MFINNTCVQYPWAPKGVVSASISDLMLQKDNIKLSKLVVNYCKQTNSAILKMMNTDNGFLIAQADNGMNPGRGLVAKRKLADVHHKQATMVKFSHPQAFSPISVSNN